MTADPQGPLPWYEAPAGQLRLHLEFDDMRARFPDFRLFRAPDGTIWWRGTLDPIGPADTDALATGPLEVAIVIPDAFPHATPKAYVMDLCKADHVNSDGRLDLGGALEPDVPPSSSGVVGRVPEWLYRFTTREGTEGGHPP